MALNGIASCEDTFAIFREWFVICDICDLWMLVWLPQEIQEISNNFLLVLVQWHIFFLYLWFKWWLIRKSFFLAIKYDLFSYFREKHFSYLFNYYNRISPKQNYPHIKIFQWSPLIPFYLDPFYPSPLPLLQHTYTSSSTPLWLRIKEYWVFAQ